MSKDRSAEIWSTRLQRELLALTTEGNNNEEVGDKHHLALLPPFVRVKEHSLDIARAKCLVTFEIEVLRADVPGSATDADADAGDGKEVDDVSTPQREFVLVTLDASMEQDANGKVQASPNTYPFQKPKAVLTSGASLFPTGSDVEDGDEIEVDCDWTPSLHLSDAALNVSLTIRESIRRGETYFKVKEETAPAEENPIDSLLKKFTAKTKKQVKSKNTNSSQQQSRRKPKNADELQIGDIINFNDAPYNMCAGMYSCKAIRRPQFIETAIAEAAALARQIEASNNPSPFEEEEDENEIPQGLGNYMKLQAGGIRKVAGSGIIGAGSFMKSFISSAKSVMEESFLMITDTSIVELRSSKFNVGSATVTFANPVSFLAKLKFRRQESISLFFKQAPDDPLIFMCPDSADAVQQIQSVLKRHGVQGKHTNAATQRAIQSAMVLVVDIKAKEKSLDGDPTVAKVDEIMSLYRQAAERFESAGDARHEEVMNHMRKFLKKQKIVSILEGKRVSSDVNGGGDGSAPKGEVFAPTNCQLASDEESDSGTSNPISPAKPSVEKMGSFDMDDSELDDLDGFLAKTTIGEDDEADESHDPVAELDAMFTAADKELSDILNS